MKRILIFLMLLPSLAFAQLSETDLKAYIDSQLPSGADIPMSTIRTVLKEMVESGWNVVDDSLKVTEYSSDGASWHATYTGADIFMRFSPDGINWTGRIPVFNLDNNLDVDSNRVINVATATADMDAVNLGQVIDSLGAKADTSRVAAIEADTANWNDAYEHISFDNDTSATNEIQTLSISNDTLFLSLSGDTVVIPASSDDQQITISNDTIYLEDGGNVKLPAETDAIVGAITGIIKSDGGGNISAAVGDTDYLLPNTPITGATKTKITYDAQGLVTSGADATTADIAASTDKNYVTDAQLTVIGNTSGTNTGDQTLSVGGTTSPTIGLSGSNTATFSGAGTVSLNQSGGTITITGTGDGTGTDDQTIDVFSISGNNVQLSLESDGEATKTVDISTTTAVAANTAKVSYPGSADATELNILDGATLTTIELNYVDGVTSSIQSQLNAKLESEVDGSITNEIQTIDVSQLSGTTLQLSLSSDGEATKEIDLSSLQDGTGTDDQTASEVNISDAGDIITAITVEGALQENRTAINLNTAKVTDDDLGVNETYGSGWNADANSPEKDDIYDYLHQFDADDDGDFSDESWFPSFSGSDMDYQVIGSTGSVSLTKPITTIRVAVSGITLTLPTGAGYANYIVCLTAYSLGASFTISPSAYSPDGSIGTIADETALIIQYENAYSRWQVIGNYNTGSAAGSGDITGVTAGEGLSGGGASGDVSLAIDIDDFSNSLTSGLASTDLLAVSDATTEKKMAVSVLQTYMQNNLSFGSVTDGDKGDITVTSGVWNIDAGVIEAANLEATNSPTDNYVWSYDAASGGGTWVAQSGGGIGGSTGSTDNAILRADGTGGATVQSSGVTIDDSDNVTVAGYVVSDNTREQSLSGTTPTMNVQSGCNAYISLTGTTTVTLSNVQTGMSGVIKVTQNGSSAYDLTISGATEVNGDGSYTLPSEINTTLSSVTHVIWWNVNSTNYYGYLYQ